MGYVGAVGVESQAPGTAHTVGGGGDIPEVAIAGDEVPAGDAVAGIIDVADIAAVEEEIKSGKFTEVKLSFSLNDESDDSGTDELDSIIDEGSFDDL